MEQKANSELIIALTAELIYKASEAGQPASFIYAIIHLYR